MATDAAVSEQAGMFDRVIDGELLGEIDGLLSDRDKNFKALDAILTALTNERNRNGAKQIGRAKRALKKIADKLELKDGERVRVGNFIVTGKLYTWEATERDEGSSITIGGIESAA